MHIYLHTLLYIEDLQMYALHYTHLHTLTGFFTVLYGDVGSCTMIVPFYGRNNSVCSDEQILDLISCHVSKSQHDSFRTDQNI